jgi:23S rRNA pseudouridine1911/1915/1917 synthase
LKQLPLQVLYEDNHLIAVNKRSGDIVQGDKTGDKPLNEIVADYLKEKYNKPGDAFVGTIHRIDRPVSGVVIFAKTSKALTRMNAQFQEKDVQKTYWAVVKNQPPHQFETVTHHLLRNRQKNKSFAYAHKYKDSKESSLKYEIIKRLDRYFLLEITPFTGRHHQIRVQLSTLGFPIKGDVKYGFDRTNSDASIHLHARKVRFEHPVTKESIEIIAKTPDEVIWNACN